MDNLPAAVSRVHDCERLVAAADRERRGCVRGERVAVQVDDEVAADCLSRGEGVRAEELNLAARSTRSQSRVDVGDNCPVGGVVFAIHCCARLEACIREFVAGAAARCRRAAAVNVRDERRAVGCVRRAVKRDSGIVNNKSTLAGRPCTVGSGKIGQRAVECAFLDVHDDTAVSVVDCAGVSGGFFIAGHAD